MIDMELDELIRRCEDLSRRCGKSGCVTSTGFLTPGEQYYIRNRFHTSDCTMLFHGGDEEGERRVLFFLPDYLDTDSFDAGEYIKAIRLTAHFGEPGHRDYMGAILGMGVGREWVGDICVRDNEAIIFCLPSVLRHLLGIDKVGRCGVTAVEISLDSVPKREKNVKNESFSVMSMRLDAVAAGMFHLSRTECAREINAGNMNLNYFQCVKADAPVRPGDVISLRGHGKGTVTGTGGTSRKGRLFVSAEILK